MIFFLAVSETFIIVILILSKLTANIVHKNLFPIADNIFITNIKIEKTYLTIVKALNLLTLFKTFESKK
jgi:hypothetical protein